MDFMGFSKALIKRHSKNGAIKAMAVMSALQLILLGQMSGELQAFGKETANKGKGAKTAEQKPAKIEKTAESKVPSTSTETKAAETKASETKSAETRKEVLEPGQFFGLASFGYASAKACPEVMEKLFCYCGCDLTDSHNSLLDCFTSTHGVDCHICQEEAVLANKLHKDGVPTSEIQKTIDDKYSSQYPFEQPTPTYQKYKASRAGGKAADNSATAKPNTVVAGPDAPDETPATKPPKLKPGKSMPKCCAPGQHEPADKSKSK